MKQLLSVLALLVVTCALGFGQTVARYHMATSHDVAATTDVKLNFETKDIDNAGDVQNAGSDWRFTAKAAGIYRVTAKVLTAPLADTLKPAYGYLYAHAAGSADKSTRIAVNYAMPKMRLPLFGSTLVSANAGDEIYVTMRSPIGVKVGDVDDNYIEVEFVGGK